MTIKTDLGYIDITNEVLAGRARNFWQDCVNRRHLDMKLVDVEVFLDRSKFIFYFTAPARIDFRELVKDLVHEYRVRIELRQIGVRHETQMIGAVGNCGMVCCCRRYLRQFAPVTIRMAKEQNLDAVHDTVHEMAKDEARHGAGFQGLYKRYFGK